MVDLGCGPGPVTLALASQGVDMLAVDPSREMLATAKERAAERGLLIGWRQGTGESIADQQGVRCERPALRGAVRSLRGGGHRSAHPGMALLEGELCRAGVGLARHSRSPASSEPVDRPGRRLPHLVVHGAARFGRTGPTPEPALVTGHARVSLRSPGAGAACRTPRRHRAPRVPCMCRSR
ncbi:class I SAM-dependent methyltransferase [Streptomyces sp. NPDC057675]|uniref:class I SAM-dependent methyltransferase n=1 Tax=Streptomyces sp. NPDC057675 TaxID=3346204 RepID=UPI0036A1A637